MKRTIIRRISALLLTAALSAVAIAAAPRAAREERPRNLLLTGRWGEPDQDRDALEVRGQRWKLKIQLAPDGTFAGSGTIRVGAEVASGNVLGKFSGRELEARIFTDDGVQMAQLDAVLTPTGISGTFLTIGGDDGWFESQNKGWLHEVLE